MTAGSGTNFTDRYPGTVAIDLSRLPQPVVARLPLYLRRLNQFRIVGQNFISSHDLGAAAAVSSEVARKDMSQIGQLGRRGKGYPVADVEQAIAQVLGVAEDQRVILIGAGNLGTALSEYAGFAARHLELVAVLDKNPQRIGTDCGGLVVNDIAELDRVIADHDAQLAIITTPAESAQEITDQLVASGITGILNFAPVELAVPSHVSVRVVDLSAELQILAFRQAAG